MQDDPRTRLIREIHASPNRSALAVAGAGVRMLGWLLGEAGASRTVVDACVPYARSALRAYLGAGEQSHVSAEEAVAMADVAYWRSLKLLAGDRPHEIGAAPAVGLACTATIATDRPKKGEHRAYVAARRAGSRRVDALTLTKGARSRSEEEEVVSRLLLNALGSACGVSSSVDMGLIDTDRYSYSTEDVGEPLAEVVSGGRQLVTVLTQGKQATNPPTGKCILAGSFNPVHEGHWQMAEAARAMTGRHVAFELSVENVEKPPLDLATVEARIAQMRGRASIVVTRAPTFVVKARLMPGSVFVIGYDTATRLFGDRFYARGGLRPDAGGRSPSIQALEEIRRHGCSFLVAGRYMGGAFRTLRHLCLPPELQSCFEEIPEQLFRNEISSTEIRERGSPR